MTGLQLFWTGLLILSVFLFFAVELTVVIGGAYNIASMLRALRSQKSGEAPPSSESDAGSFHAAD